MKITTKLSAFLLLSFAIASTLQAGSSYILGQGGAYDGLADYQNDKGRGYSWRLGAGYSWDTAITIGKEPENQWVFCFNYGLESAYQDYQNVKKSRTISSGRTTFTIDSNYHRQVIDLLAVLDIDITPKFDIFGKFGPAYVLEREYGTSYFTSNNAMFWNRKIKARTLVPKLIVGTGYNLTPKVNVNLAFTHEFETDNSTNASSVLAGVQYNFL